MVDSLVTPSDLVDAEYALDHDVAVEVE